MDYIVYRNDYEGRGDSVLLAVKRNISSKLMNSLSHVDLLSVSITYSFI